MTTRETNEVPTVIPSQQSVMMLDEFVKNLTATNEVLALSVAQLSVLIDLELQDIRRIYNELGMPQVTADASPDEWLLAIRSGCLPAKLRQVEDRLKQDDSEYEVKPKVEGEFKPENTAEVSTIARPPATTVSSTPSTSSTHPQEDIDAFAFYLRHVGATVRREHKSALRGDVSEAWLEAKLAAKWSSLTPDEKLAWQRAAQCASRVS